MVPRWTLALAFLAGLLPGGLLYWRARQAQPAPPVVLQATPAPTAVIPTPQETTEPKSETPQPHSTGRRATAVFDAAELGRLLAERSQQLEVAQSGQADLTRQLRELEAKMDGLTQEDAKRRASEADLREQVAQLQKQLESASALAQTKEATLRENEAALKQLRQEAAEGAQRGTRRRQIRTELEELGRRRESYLNNIITRYREATDLFRTMSLRLDNPRDASSPLSNDLSRIQQAIQLADEDIRQLRVLNAQAARLQKDLN